MSQLVGKDSRDRWYPNSINDLKDYILTYHNLNNDNKSGLVSNLAYNFQYIEYLRKTLLELNLSTVLKTQTIKSFIITSLSIIEALIIEISSSKRNVKFNIAIEKFKKLRNCPFNNDDIQILDKLRVLRNHIHLNKASDSNSTDYKKFWIVDYCETKRLLYILITSKHFESNEKDLFQFLNKNKVYEK